MTNCYPAAANTSYVECGIYNGDSYDIAEKPLIDSTGIDTGLNAFGIYNVQFNNIGARDNTAKGAFVNAEWSEVELSNVKIKNNGNLTNPNSFIYINNSRVKNFKDMSLTVLSMLNSQMPRY